MITRVDEMTDEEAMKRIRELLDEQPGLDAYDISCKLNLSARKAVELTNRLLDENKIEIIEEEQQ